MNRENCASSDHLALEERIGYRFRRHALLAAALTHSSAYTKGAAGRGEDFERLEFIGDAVVGLVAAQHLAEVHPDAREGELTRMRAALVEESALAAAARDLGLGALLVISPGEESTGGREKPSILADAFEALVGAVFLDGGWLGANRFCCELLSRRADAAAAVGKAGDAKTRLQELCQKGAGEAPVYTLVEQSGPAHRPRFVAEARLGERMLGRGEGWSRKSAEQAAAAAALDAFDDDSAKGEA